MSGDKGLTVSELAREAGVTQWRIREALRRGLAHARPSAGKTTITRADWDRWVERQRYSAENGDR